MVERFLFRFLLIIGLPLYLLLDVAVDGYSFSGALRQRFADLVAGDLA